MSPRTLTRSLLPAAAQVLAQAFADPPAQWLQHLRSEATEGRLSLRHSRLLYDHDLHDRALHARRHAPPAPRHAPPAPRHAPPAPRHASHHHDRHLQGHGEPIACCLAHIAPAGLGRIGGTGVIPARQGQGFGRVTVLAVIRALESAGVRQLTLEAPALDPGPAGLYRSLGFRDHRELLVFSGHRDNLCLPPGTPKADPIPPTVAITRAAELHTTPQVFQRQTDYLRRFDRGVGAFGAPAGPAPYNAIAIQRGRALLDIAVDTSVSTSEWSLALASVIWAAADHSWSIRVVHVPADHPMAPQLSALGLSLEQTALEMIRHAPQNPKIPWPPG